MNLAASHFAIIAFLEHLAASHVFIIAFRGHFAFRGSLAAYHRAVGQLYYTGICCAAAEAVAAVATLQPSRWIVEHP